jgi:hypothetical protein
MRIFRYSYSFLLIVLLSACLEEELPDHGYPVVTTSVATVSTNGVHFNGTIQFEHLEEVTDHGFVWGTDKENLALTKSFFVSLGAANGLEFSATVGSTLETKVFYYVRSFAKTKTKTVYGPIVKFLSLGSEGPQITSFTPTEGAYGDTVIITGKNFNFKKEINVVTFGGVAASVANATDTELKVVAPSLVKVKNEIKVSILDNIAASNGTFDVKAPSVQGVVNSVFSVCDTVVIQGENLGAFGDKPEVTFNYFHSTVISVTPQQIKVVLPWIVQNPLNLKIKSGLFEVNAPFTLTQLQPAITSIEPVFYAPGDTVSVTLANWATCQTISARLFDTYSNYPVTVIESSASTMKFIAPKSCIQSSRLHVFGQTISISSPIELKPALPKVFSIQPNHGSVNDEVVITGENLPEIAWWNIPTNFLDVTSASPTELRGRVMELLLMDGPTIDVYVTGCGGSTIIPAAFTFDAPEIHSVFPSVVTQWDEIITISGKNFSEYQNMIEIAGVSIPYSIMSSPEGDVITVPVSDILYNQQVSQHLTGNVKITTGTGQSVTSTQNVTINYESIWRQEENLPGLPRTGVPFMTINGKGYTGLGLASPDLVMLKDWWEFDEVSGWTQKASFPDQGDALYTQSAVADGKGYFGFFSNSKKWWQYDPSTDQWQRKADFPGQNRFLDFAFGLNGKIYLGGGRNISEVYFKDFWEYDPASDQWTQKANLPDFALAHPLGFAHEGKGYTFGKIGTVLTTFSYDPATNQWATQAVAGGAPDFVSNWRVMKFDDFALFQSYQYSWPHFYKFDPDSNSFIYIQSNYGASKASPALFVLNNRGYIGLGYHDYIYSNSMWSFDPAMLH